MLLHAILNWIFISKKIILSRCIIIVSLSSDHLPSINSPIIRVFLIINQVIPLDISVQTDKMIFKEKVVVQIY